MRLMLYNQARKCLNTGRLMRPLTAVLLLVCLGLASGCQPEPSQMAKLGMESLGLVVDAGPAEYLEPVITAYMEPKLPEVRITGSQTICDYLGLQLGYLDCLSVVASIDQSRLLDLRKHLGIEYLAAISIEAGDSPRHTTSITVGTDKTEVRLSQYKTVTLRYTIIDTAGGETIFSGQALGKSSDIADLKVGTKGTQVGIQLSDERDLLKEAVRNALKETGLF